LVTALLLKKQKAQLLVSYAFCVRFLVRGHVWPGIGLIPGPGFQFLSTKSILPQTAEIICKDSEGDFDGRC